MQFQPLDRLRRRASAGPRAHYSAPAAQHRRPTQRAEDMFSRSLIPDEPGRGRDFGADFDNQQHQQQQQQHRFAAPKTGAVGGASTASVVVFAFALSGIILVFLLFYFLAKICAPSLAEEEWKDVERDAADPRPVFPRKTATTSNDTPRHVLYPRRIYELQAEEGCYSSLPSMSEPEVPADTVVVLRADGRAETAGRKRSGLQRLMRKLTTSSAPIELTARPAEEPKARQ